MDREERDVRSSGVSKSLPEDAPQQGKEKRGIPEQNVTSESGLGAPLLPHKQLKVERAIRKEIFRDVYAIRIYPSELPRTINSTIERGERPRFLIKLQRRAKTDEEEVELVFLGTRHFEPPSYWEKPPADWVTWGEIVFPKQGAKEFGILLLEIILGQRLKDHVSDAARSSGIEESKIKALKDKLQFYDLSELPWTRIPKVTIWKIVSVKRHRKARK